MYKKTLLSVAIASTLTLTGCLDSDVKNESNAAPPSPATDVTFALFDPTISVLPVPSDFLAAGSTDGTYSASSSLASLDFLDGASTTAPINVPFSGAIDPTTVDGRAFIDRGDGVYIPNPTQNVFLLDIDFPGGDELVTVEVEIGGTELGEVPTFKAGVLYTAYSDALTAAAGNTADAAVVAALEALLDETDFRVEAVTLDGREGTVRIMPRKPLNPESKYIVVATNGILDTDGDAVSSSPTHQLLMTESREFFDGSSALQGIWDALRTFEDLATGWFDAATNLSRAGVMLDPLTADNIALAYTVTTAGTDPVLKAMAAPENFFIKKATTDAKQAGVTALLDGSLPLLTTAATPTSTLEAFFQGLTSNPASPLYIEGVADGTYASYLALAGAVAAGATGVSSTDLYKIQTAAATANLSDTNDDTGPGTGDGTTIATTAVGQVAGIETAIPGALSRPASGITDKETTNTPGAVTTFDTFLPIGLGITSNDPADPVAYALPSAGVNAEFVNPGLIMQGQIDVPYFLPDASATGAPAELVTGTWDANTAASAAGVTPPSDKVTYRFPFAGLTGTETIPFMLSVPDEDNDGIAEPPAGGYPVVIYQHGIFGSRGHSLPIGNGLGAGCLSGGANPTNAEVVNAPGQDAPRCFATIAIDMPLHGFAPTNAPGTTPDAFTQGGLSVDVDSIANDYAARDWSATHYAGLHERHFGFSKAADGTPTPMVYDDTDTATETNSVGYPGEFYINLAQPAGSRDNLRQSVMDLLTLNASLGDIDVNGDGVGDLNTDRVYFVGHSLGGIVGTTFVAINNDAQVQAYTTDLPDLKAASLQTTGGQITRILENSPALGGSILAGLRAAGVTQGTSSFETFMNTSQAAITSADSINFAAKIADSGLPVLATEIYGDGTDRDTQDDTIANGVDSVDGAYFDPAIDAGTGIQALNSPLAGTEPLLSELDLDSLTAGFTEDNVDGITGAVRFSEGEHITIITGDPASVIGEMGTQLVTFFSSLGMEVAVGTVDAGTISTADPDISN